MACFAWWLADRRHHPLPDAASFHAPSSATARRSVPGLDAALARGDLRPLVGWLRAKVHGVGNLLGFNDLLRATTGKPLDPADFEAHLTARYLS